MNVSDFDTLVSGFSHNPKSGRHVFLWRGRKAELEKTLPSDITTHLDIHTLATTSYAVSSGTYELRRQFSKEIIKTLQERKNRLTAPQILVVTGCDLLARYELGIRDFYDHYVGDGVMVVFVVPQHNMKHPWPTFVKFDPDATVRYLEPLIEKDHVLQEES